MSKKKNKKSKNKNSVRILPISIIMFLLLTILALFIIFNKGKIAGYSLVKIVGESSGKEVADLGAPEPQEVLELAVDKKYISSKPKETATITAQINGSPIELSEVELKSSNEDVIKIDSTGVATAVADGKSTITATKGDLEAKVDIHVITPIKSMTFTTTNSNVKVGKSLQMKLVAKPSDASIETLKYESSDEEIATVNSNGIVTGVSPGKVKITVTDTYTGSEKTLNLNIIKGN